MLDTAMTTRTDTDDAQWITTGLDIAGHFRVTGALDRSAIGNWATVVAAESLDLSFCPLGVTGEPWTSRLLDQPGLVGVGAAFVGATPR